MGIITVEGLGQVEIEGDVPNEEEQKALKKALQGLNETTDVETESTTESGDVNISPNLGDTEESSINENITSEIIESNSEKVKKVEGLDKFLLTRPVFEATGAIAGAIPGTVAGGLPGSVAFGALGATGGGQLYDILQSYLTDTPTDFVTQVGRTKSDLQREFLLQSFFSKIPGLGYKIRGLIYGKGDRALYDAAKRLGYPLSLSDAGNMIGTGYGRVIGIFPYVGDPIKKKILTKSAFLNENSNKVLNTFAPNVSLTKLGMDMTKASKNVYGDFKRVSTFFYDDFYKAVDTIGNTPVISTKNFKESLKAFVTLVDGGAIKLTTGKKLKGPRRDTLYRYAKDATKLQPYINATQYKSLIEDIKYYSKLAVKGEPYNLKVLTQLKEALETDLRLLTKKSYRDNLLKNVYPMSKTKRAKIDDKILSDIANKLKFADEVYANGIENSLILSKTLKNKLSKETIETGSVPGAKAFDKPVTSTFKQTDRNIFGPGFERPGSITADQLAETLLKRNASPQLLNDLRVLVGEKQFNRFVRRKLQKSFNDSLLTSTVKPGEIIFDPYKFEKNLGLTTDKGREVLEALLKGSKLSIQNLDDFFLIAKNHAGLKIPDVSSFLARRGVLGGFKSLSGGAIIGLGAGVNPLATSALFLFARKTSRMLSSPGALEKVMIGMDANAPLFQRKTAVLKLLDAAISDSKTKQEENELKLMRESIEDLSLDNLKKGLEETLDSSQEFLNFNNNVFEKETQDTESITGDTSQAPTGILSTSNINPNLFAQAPANTTTNQGLTEVENALLREDEKILRLRQRGLA